MVKVLYLICWQVSYCQLPGYTYKWTKHKHDDHRGKRRFKSCISFVPQFYYLSNSTIAENIAFGIDTEEIDYAQVEKSAVMANISEYIKTLPLRYNTIVGENGLTLSGGQRQRIALARAFYRNPQIIIFDEATSALDSSTEATVMKNINKMHKEITIISVAHRLTTLTDFDRIIRLENGSVVDQGSPRDLIP